MMKVYNIFYSIRYDHNNYNECTNYIINIKKTKRSAYWCNGCSWCFCGSLLKSGLVCFLTF